MTRRLPAAIMLLIFGSMLGSCAPFAGFVSDNWPTWAGGMPKDVPPRPGAPGYEEFLAHQAGRDVTPAGSGASAAQPPTVAAPAADNGNARPPPANRRQDDDQSAVRGGLY